MKLGGIFQPVPKSDLDDETILQEKIRELYDGEDGNYDFDSEVCDKQFEKMFKELQAGFLFKTLKDKFDGKEELRNSTYPRVKKSLEKILIQLKSLPEAKQKPIKDRLQKDLQVCGPGVDSNLLQIYVDLNQQETMVHWLARIREEILLNYSRKHISENTVMRSYEIHVYPLFFNYANKQGWNIPGSEIRQEITGDMYATSGDTGVDKQALTKFRKEFLSTYNLLHIAEWVRLEVLSSLRDKISTMYPDGIPSLHKIDSEGNILLPDEYTPEQFKEYWAAFSDLQKAIEPILEESGYSLDQVLEAIPGSDKYGFSLYSEVTQHAPLVPIMMRLFNEKMLGDVNDVLAEKFRAYNRYKQISVFQEILSDLIRSDENDQMLATMILYDLLLDPETAKQAQTDIATYLASQKKNEKDVAMRALGLYWQVGATIACRWSVLDHAYKTNSSWAIEALATDDEKFLFAAKYGVIAPIKELLVKKEEDKKKWSWKRVLGFLSRLFGRDNSFVNVRNKQDGNTALIYAVENGRLDVVRELLAHKKIDPNARNKRGDTALMFAAKGGYLDVVEELLAHKKTKSNIRSNSGNTALMHAASYGHTKVVEALLARGVDPKIRNKKGYTALIHAAENGHLEAVNVLLKNEKIDPNVRNNYGATAFMCAAKNGHLEVVNALLNNEKIDPNVKDNYENMALIYAVRKGHLEVVKVLLSNEKIDPNARSISGTTALSVANANGYSEIANIIQEKIEERVAATVQNKPKSTRDIFGALQKVHSDDVKQASMTKKDEPTTPKSPLDLENDFVDGKERPAEEYKEPVNKRIRI